MTFNATIDHEKWGTVEFWHIKDAYDEEAGVSIEFDNESTEFFEGADLVSASVKNH